MPADKQASFHADAENEKPPLRGFFVEADPGERGFARVVRFQASPLVSKLKPMML